MTVDAAVVGRPARSEAPPPPHDPAERACVFEHGDWQVRAFAWNDDKHAYLAPRGMLHLQLWNPRAGLSILTRSILTGGAFELWSPAGRWRVCCYGHLARTLLDELGTAPPCPRLVDHFETWLVLAAQIGAVPKPRPS